MSQYGLDPRLQDIFERTAQIAMAIVGELTGTTNINAEVRNRTTAAFFSYLTTAISRRDVIAELNEALDSETGPTLRALAKIGLPDTDSAEGILNSLSQSPYLDRDIRDIRTEDIREISDSLRRNYVDSLIGLKAFVRAHEESDRQFPVPYQENKIEVTVASGMTEVFQRLANNSRTNRGLALKLARLDAKYS